MRQTQRILALAPGTRHLGSAEFEGEDLVRFGVKTFPGKKTRVTHLPKLNEYLEKLFAARNPQVVVVEELYYAQASLSPLLRAQIDAIKRWSKRRRLRVLQYRPTTAKEHFCQGKRTRRALAEAMVRRYWFLASFLKHTHTPRAQQYWQQMFDAVALGALAVQGLKTRSVGFGQDRDR